MIIKMNKKGQVWISAALYTALGVILVTLILSVGMPFVDKLKARNTILQTKGVMYDFDEIIRTVNLEGLGSRRPLYVDIGEGDFLIDSENDKLIWSFFAEDQLGIEPDLLNPIKEGNLNIQSTSLGQGYRIELFLDYSNENVDIEALNLKLLSGKYNLVAEHRYETSDFVEIREA